MHGVFIEHGLSDWQIVQHEDHKADITLSGSYIVPRAAMKQGVADAKPMVRVLMENDNSQVIPWTYTDRTEDDDTHKTGIWSITLTIPAGGLYRIETGLETTSTMPGIVWTFRGDTRLHVGVGDVFLIGGQSNSAGYGKDVAFDPPQMGVHLYRNRHQWDIACHPINESSFNADAPNAEMGVSGVSPYLSFGKRFSASSHYPVGLIATAMGGQPMKRWKPAEGKLYRNMLEQAKACGKLAGVLWYQGCSDTDENKAPGYKERYYEMIRSFREDLGYPIKFFTFQLNRQINGLNDSGWGMVREAQRSATHDFEDVYLLPTMTCSLSDGIHNSAHSCMMLGESMAKMAGHVLYHTPEFKAPEIQSAVVRDNILTLTFANMKSGFVVSSDLAIHSGLTIEDADGEIAFEKFVNSKTARNTLEISLSRPIHGEGFVSFAWQADPTRVPVMDEMTFLPPLSFYKFPITN